MISSRLRLSSDSALPGAEQVRFLWNIFLCLAALGTEWNTPGQRLRTTTFISLTSNRFFPCIDATYPYAIQNEK